MSSKLLKFKQTEKTRLKQVLNDVVQMSDISFKTIMNTSGFIIDIQMLTPEESIIQSLKNLISLPIGGNVLFPERGEKVGNMLFAAGLSQNEAEDYITSYLSANEPRITIHSVKGSKQINEFNEQIVTLNVSYSFKNSNKIHTVIVDLKSTIA